MFLSLAPLGDVHGRADQADHLASLIEQRRLGRVPPGAGPVGIGHGLVEDLGRAALHHALVVGHDRRGFGLVVEQLHVRAAHELFVRASEQLGGPAVAHQELALAVLGVDDAGHSLEKGPQQVV